MTESVPFPADHPFFPGPSELPVLEFGRYRIWQTPDGGWLLARAAFTCERCQGCGCGEQQDHVTVPGMMVRMAQAMQKDGGGLSPLAMLRRLRGAKRGDNSESSGGGAETAESGDPAGPAVDLVPALGLPDQEGSRGAGDGSQGGPGPV